MDLFLELEKVYHNQIALRLLLLLHDIWCCGGSYLDKKTIQEEFWVS